MTSSHCSRAVSCTFHTWLDGAQLKSWCIMIGKGVYMRCDKGFSSGVKKSLCCQARLSLSATPLLLDWFPSTSSLFSTLLDFIWFLCRFKRNRVWETPQGWWLDGAVTLLRLDSIENWLALRLCCHSHSDYRLCGGYMSEGFICMRVCLRTQELSV